MPKPSTPGSVRIISGEWRSRRIAIPPEEQTRPMLDRVKAAVFDMLGSYLGTPGGLPSIAVADVFAGGGTLGLEALSRGARTCVFVERDPTALAILRRNLHSLQVGPCGVIEPIDGWSPLLADVLSEHGTSLILLDPPYRDLRAASEGARLPRLLRDLGQAGRWAEAPLVMLHYPPDAAPAEEQLEPWTPMIDRTYGNSGIMLLSPRWAESADARVERPGP